MSVLDRLKLSFRCPADWEAMEGDERKRFCVHCQKDVHNLSAMSRDEAEAVVGRGGELCVRMTRRKDGGLVTEGCPKTVEVRSRAVRMAGVCLAAGGALALASCEKDQHAVGEIEVPVEEEHEIIGDLAIPDPALMGRMCPVEKVDVEGNE